MPAHQRVRAWVAQHYQRPTVDQEWLADCSDWLSSELGLDPDRDLAQFVQHVEAQLLQSNLADSTVPGSGLDPLLVAPNPGPARPRPFTARRPASSAPRHKRTTGPTPLLVEIRSITEIAHSAFSLLNTHQVRLDRADLDLAQEENAEQHRDDEGPVPTFPRGMLKFELSDGLTTFRAIEFRSLPQLELGVTPLGYKMFLNSTPIRNGIAFLEPANVVLKGYRTEDHDISGEQVFLSSLRKRLGRPDPPPEAPVAAAQPAQPAHRREPPPMAQPQSPPTDIDDMYVDDVDPDVLREMALQIDEATDAQQNQRVSIHALQSAGSSSTSKEKHDASSSHIQTSHLDTTAVTPFTVTTSPYFTAPSSESKPIPDIGLSPRPNLIPNPKPDFDITLGTNNPELSNLSVNKPGSTSARPPPTVLAKRVPPGKQPAPPDPYDELSFDMDVDESFFEQVGMIEQGALSVGTSSKGKGKDKDVGTEDMGSCSRPSIASSRKAPSGSAPSTKLSAKYSVLSSGAEPSTRMRGSGKRANSASSLSGSTESPMPQTTQSSDHCLSRDPSLIVISSEDETLGDHDTIRPPNVTRRRANKRKKMGRGDVVGSDVIDISD